VASTQPARGGPADSRDLAARQRLELVAAVLLAVATVATAWSAFQSAKWGGVMTTSYSAAAAARTESNRSATLAGQQTIIDVQLFTDWLAAHAEETGDVGPPAGYQPDPAAYSGFLFDRFREEFRPAVRAWLAEDPATDPDAPPSPFAMDEYALAAAQQAEQQQAAAEASAARAQAANATKDNYVLATVLCASVLFFGGIGARLSSTRRRAAMVALAAVALVGTAVVLATYPVRW
jgi:hypothetical protein